MFGVDPGPHDSTADDGAVAVVGAAVVIVVGAAIVVVLDTWVVGLVAATVLFEGDEEWEPAVNPMARPTPRAARMAAPIATRTTVLRRKVITRGSSSTIVADTSARSVQCQKGWGVISHLIIVEHTGQRGRPPCHLATHSRLRPCRSPTCPSQDQTR